MPSLEQEFHKIEKAIKNGTLKIRIIDEECEQEEEADEKAGQAQRE